MDGLLAGEAIRPGPSRGIPWKFNDEDSVTTLSESKPQGYGHIRHFLSSTTGHQMASADGMIAEHGSTCTGSPCSRGPRPDRSGRYLSERAQLHDDPDGVLCDDSNQLHDVRVVKLAHRH